MSTPLINPVFIELKIKVPVATIRAHFSTAIESPSPWFTWKETVYDKDDSPIQSTLTYWQYGNERKLAERVVTDRDFAEGLQKFLIIHGLTTRVQYHGEGEWDIDADGADSIVQYIVYDDLLLS